MNNKLKQPNIFRRKLYIMAIYKVFYQDDRAEVIVRENTQTIYVEGNSEEEVRKYLKDRNYNIEFITKLEGAHLEYEQKSEHFEVEHIQ